MEERSSSDEQHQHAVQKKNNKCFFFIVLYPARMTYHLDHPAAPSPRPPPTSSTLTSSTSTSTTPQQHHSRTPQQEERASSQQPSFLALSHLSCHKNTLALPGTSASSSLPTHKQHRGTPVCPLSAGRRRCHKHVDAKGTWSHIPLVKHQVTTESIHI